MPAPRTGQDHSSSQQERISKFWLLPELLRLVQSHVSQSDFAALCRVCRSLYNSANPLLYEDIVLDLSEDTASRMLDRLHAALAASSHLANAVRSIHSRLPDPDDGSTDGEARTHISTLSATIQRCPKLREVHISDHMPLPDSAFTDVDNALSYLPSLSHLTFSLSGKRWDHTPIDDHPWHFPPHSLNESTLLHALSLPSLHHVALTVYEAPSGPLRIPTYPTNPSITHLTLHNAQLTTTTIAKLIPAVPHVRALDLSFLYWADAHHTWNSVGARLDVAALGAAVAGAHATLERLRLAVEYDTHSYMDGLAGGGNGSEWGPHGVFPSLRHCTRLRAIEVAPEVLLGGWNGEAVGNLAALLPGGLEELVFLTGFFGWYGSPWEFGPLCDKVVGDLRAMGRRALERAALERVEIAWAEEDVGEIGDLVQDMTWMCEGLGVCFELKPVEFRGLCGL